MGRYNRQARRKMRKSLGAGTKISNDALETAIDIQREAMQADKLVPTMKNLISEDLRKKYERQVNQEILPRIIEQYTFCTRGTRRGSGRSECRISLLRFSSCKWI